jgi:hypothetical protein
VDAAVRTITTSAYSGVLRPAEWYVNVILRIITNSLTGGNDTRGMHVIMVPKTGSEISKRPPGTQLGSELNMAASVVLRATLPGLVKA